jgi:hypothetical protein
MVGYTCFKWIMVVMIPQIYFSNVKQALIESDFCRPVKTLRTE